MSATKKKTKKRRASDVEPLPPERERWPWWWWWVLGAVVLLVLSVWVYALTRDDPSHMGAAGDSVAWVTSLLTLAAVGAALYTNHLQRHEIALQRHELELQRREQRRSADALEGQLAASSRLAEAMQQQAIAIAESARAQTSELERHRSLQRLEILTSLSALELDLATKADDATRPVIELLTGAGAEDPVEAIKRWAVLVEQGRQADLPKDPDIIRVVRANTGNTSEMMVRRIQKGLSLYLAHRRIEQGTRGIVARLRAEPAPEREEAPDPPEGVPGAEGSAA